MKQLIIAIAVFSGLFILGSTNNASISTSFESSKELSQNYTFVGTFKFYGYSSVTRQYGYKVDLKVYESSNACGMYWVELNGEYYKMFKTNEGGFNYYASTQRYGKIYTKI